MTQSSDVQGNINIGESINMEKKKHKMKKSLAAEQSGVKKKRGKFSDTWFGLLLTTFFLIYVLGGLLSEVIRLLILLLKDVIPSCADEIETVSFYLPFIMIWFALLLWCWCFKGNRPILKTITKLKGNTPGFFYLGIGIGFVMNGFCILMAFLNKNIELSFSGFNILSLVLIFITVLIQSSAEEIICRGFLYYRLQRRYNKPVVSIVLSSVLFGVLHLLNPGVTVLSVCNLILFGIFFGMLVYYLDSMWCAFAVHASWNFTQNIIFGLPNSGIPAVYSVFKLNPDTASNGFCYNTGFGVEGTFIAVIVISAVIAVLYLLREKIACKEPYEIWNSTDEVNADHS